MKDDRVYLVFISECIERIGEYTASGRDAFMQHPMAQDAVLRNLHTLSESAQRISDELKKQHPEVLWRSIIAFRQVVVHDYLEIDLDRIWEIVERDLPTLNAQVASILATLSDE